MWNFILSCLFKNIFPKIHEKKKKKKGKVCPVILGLFYRNKLLPRLTLLIPRLVLSIIGLACLTEISVDILEASFLYSYLHLSCMDLCSLCLELTSIM